MNEICKNLKHKLLIPQKNSCIDIIDEIMNYTIKCKDGSVFSIPKTDVRLLEIDQISNECLAKFVANELLKILNIKHKESMSSVNMTRLKIKISEDHGKKGVYSLKLI